MICPVNCGSTGGCSACRPGSGTWVRLDLRRAAAVLAGVPARGGRPPAPPRTAESINALRAEVARLTAERDALRAFARRFARHDPMCQESNQCGVNTPCNCGYDDARKAIGGGT